MGADSLAENAENTENAQELVCPICQPNLYAQAQKFWNSMKKRLHLASVVRAVHTAAVLDSTFE